MRRKRPPLLMFLLRKETLRRPGAWCSLLVVDFVGVTAAIVHRHRDQAGAAGRLQPRCGVDQHRSPLAFAYLLTVLMFARADLYADRPRRPGLPKIFSALFQATVIALMFALATGNHFKSYYIFYGALFFGTAYISVAARAVHPRHRLGARAGRLPAPRAAGGLGQAHRGGGPRAGRPVADPGGRSSATSRSRRGPENGLRSLGRLDELSDVLGNERIDEVIIADPDFPQERAVDLVDRCHQRGVTVHVAPSTMEILIDRAVFMPGESVPLFTLRPPVFEGVQFAAKRTFDLALSTIGLVLLSPVLLAIAVAVKLSSRGPVIYRSVRPGMGGKPFSCFKFRTMREHADQIQDDLEPLNELSGALFKIREDPRLTRSGGSCAASRWTSCPSWSTSSAARCHWWGRGRCRCATSSAWRTGTRSATWSCPGITGLWQVSGRAELDFDDLVRLDFLYLERWSILLDLSILLKTIPAVLTRRGAF